MVEVLVSKSNCSQEYEQKIVTAEEAVKAINCNDTVYVHSHAAAPGILIDAMVARAPELRNVKVVHILTLGKADYVKPEYSDSFKLQALFIGPNVRAAVNEGRADYMPVFLSEIPYLFE